MKTVKREKIEQLPQHEEKQLCENTMPRQRQSLRIGHWLVQDGRPGWRCRHSVTLAPVCTGQKGVDLAINTVGGTVFAEDIRVLAFEGRLATVGYVDGVVHADIDLEALHARRLTLFGVSNKLRTKDQKSAAVPRFAGGKARP